MGLKSVSGSMNVIGDPKYCSCRLQNYMCCKSSATPWGCCPTKQPCLTGQGQCLVEANVETPVSAPRSGQTGDQCGSECSMQLGACHKVHDITSDLAEQYRKNVASQYLKKIITIL